MSLNLNRAMLSSALFTALLLTACGGGTTTGTTTGTTSAASSLPANGTATFSGTNVADIPTGPTFTASTAKINDVTVPAPNYQVIIYGSQSTATDIISLSYSESQSPFGTTYSAVLSFISPTTNLMWRADSVGTQVLGVTFDKVGRTIQLTNVAATAMIGTTPSNIVINGTFNY